MTAQPALRLRWQRSVAIAAAGAAAFVGTAIAAVPAQAHTPQWSVTCDSVSIDLKAYADSGNKVTVKAGDKTLIDETFGKTYTKKVDLPEHTAPLKVTAQVVASDDAKFNWGPETKTAPVCDDGKPTPTPSPSTPESSSPSPSTSASPSQSASEKPVPSAPETSSSAAPAEKPQGGGGDLAETGSSSNTPMIAGIAAAVVVVGGALVVFARKRRSSQG
ncbi:LPXTG cell wall anchor domain-containing protein [Streptomyces albus subsp. chlorinus]|uniref:LAETG motif-containing sortase-dependent surface protein n=1 Tax=Streptomyces albus TaxID=1888 RepID=UPI00157025CD|nr:LAETG motif-containing sortase-dependent surface protein [Streptomyces albus]NSC23980.1 LPXTG cell wall anchor domain-containing protein [Streptomyces albus subsp. chlorinus]